MKRLLVITLIAGGLILLSGYIFLPKIKNASNTEQIQCGINGINRLIMVENKWEKWWPGVIQRDSLSDKNIFQYNNYNYTITGYKYNSLTIQVQAEDFIINSMLIFFPLKDDSVNIEWQYSLETNSNPINKIHLYWETKKLNSNIKAVLESMKKYLEKQENVYGMKISQEIVKDTVLITTKFSSDQYPSTSKIYNYINNLKDYVSKNNATETNFPMLHVWPDSGLYHSTIAIPVSRSIPGNDTFSIKKMVPGKILMSEVTGGSSKTKEALAELEMYMLDKHLSSPAIPFESLVTNRMAQPDTSKWVTKIYYPIF